MKIVDIVYYSHNDFASTAEVLAKHAASFGYVKYLKERADVSLIKHFAKQVKQIVNGVPVMFFRRPNRFWHIPFKTHNYIRSLKPDVVIVEGLIFPLQTILLKLKLGRKSSIIVQHHGERPFSGLKRIIQVLADKCIDAYLFTSIGNSDEWIAQQIIKNEGKCHEVLEASSLLSPLDKQQSRTLLNIGPGIVYLWVGRLDENKDPLIVLRAFQNYLSVNAAARLYMIYHTEELLPQIKKLLKSDTVLKGAVTLIGKVPYSTMASWYSAADIYIAASRREGSGYALLEAISCGCIPVVSCIPSFRKITGNGTIGFLYPRGDVEYLSAILEQIDEAEVDVLSARTKRYFNEKLSFRNIADDIYKICLTLQHKKI